MAGAGFKTFAAGSVFTASDANTYLMQQAVMVFANEAARDAAITSPSEGMIAYLTAPTVPAATGAITAVPTGAKTIYNGTNWVCVTEVAAASNTAGTIAAGAYANTLTGDTTVVSVTLVTGTTALLMYGGNMFTSGGSGKAHVTVAVSGATTLAASDTYSAMVEGNGLQTSGNTTFVLTGLTAGTNTFTLNYKAVSFTATFNRRWLVAKGVA